VLTATAAASSLAKMASFCSSASAGVRVVSRAWLSTSRISDEATSLSVAKLPASSSVAIRSTAPAQLNDDSESSLRGRSPPSEPWLEMGELWLGEKRRRRRAAAAPTSTRDVITEESAPNASFTWAVRVMVPDGRRMSREEEEDHSNSISVLSPSTW